MEERLDKLLKSMEGADSLLILPHNDPDPDAIASAVALRHLLAEKLDLEGQIAYRGIIGRAENKALVRYLGRPLRRLKLGDLRRAASIALVDTQPGAGNNAWTPQFTTAIVLDHHPQRETTATAAFVDVRPHLGATSTILTEYLQAANVEPPPRLATALFYGIKTDTMGLGRGASPADVAAYFYLQSRIDIEALTAIERAQVPAAYFKSLNAALEATRVYDNVVICTVGAMHRPDLAAEMADILLRLEGIDWVICMGDYRGTLFLSVRNQRSGAGRLAQAIVGAEGTAGGHGTMAGGQVPLKGQDPAPVVRRLVLRALTYLNIARETVGHPLI